MSNKTRWGILGTGRIAGIFATGLQSIPDAEISAVGSRSQSTADTFGDRFEIPRRHPTYEALAKDADVDVIYVSTPHQLHMESAILCLNHGKPVLCEKPFAINRWQTEQIVNTAREKKLFLMEAHWSRFLPHMVKFRELLSRGAIGEPRMLQVNFGFRTDVDPEGRLFNKKYGGGALLDVGCYNVALSSMIFGPPKQIVSMPELGSTGVDEQSAFIFGHDKGQLSVMCAAIRTNTDQEANLFGTEGRIRLNAPFWGPSSVTLKRTGKDADTFETPADGNGYNYEAIEVARCLREEKLESDVVSLDESLALMATMDEIRAQWGLAYPMEAS